MSFNSRRRGRGRGQTSHCVRQYNGYKPRVDTWQFQCYPCEEELANITPPTGRSPKQRPLKYINTFQSSVYFKTINQWHNFIIKDKHPRHTKGCFVRWVQGERAGRGRPTPRFSFFRRAWFSGVIVWDPLGAVVADQIVEQSNKQNCTYGIASSLARLWKMWERS